MVKCKSCHGTYEPLLPDGTLYFHACPPLSPWELEAAIGTGLVVLTPAQQRLVDAATALDTQFPLAKDVESRRQATLAQLAVPRPLRRDENVPSTLERDSGTRKADGTGVQEITPAGVVVRELP